MTLTTTLLTVLRIGTRIGALAVVLAALASCVTVKPQQRAVLADPIMRFDGDPQAAAQLRHAIDNREGSYGGSGVSGGGCGCN
jgi:hypothetical protein